MSDGVPTGAGWFVANAREVPWEHDRMRSRAHFGGAGEAHFDQIGVAVHRLEQGGAMAMYHHEVGQEDFLVLAGRPLLLVEDTERELAPWDLVHCPPRTPHTIVNPGAEPAIVFAVGARVECGSARYPRSAPARRHGVEGEGETAADAYRDIVPEPGPPPPL